MLQIIIISMLLTLIIYFMMNTIENFSCCDGANRYKNLYQNTKQFEHERRFGNVLSYELNP
jgi:hypothetical protein